jgi:hypothetical protein
MFYQNGSLFHGPGGGPGSWMSIQNQMMGDMAIRSGVSKTTVLTVQEFATVRKINWQAIKSKVASQLLGPRLFALADSVITARWALQFYYSVSLTNLTLAASKGGIKAAAAQQAILRVTAAGGSTVAPTITRQAARAAIRRQIVKRGAVKLGLRAIPYVGWGLLAWDVYTITTRGELWGVKLYTEEEVAIT